MNQQRWQRDLRRLLHREPVLLLTVSVLVGVSAGVSALLLIALIDAIWRVSFQGLPQLFPLPRRFWYLLMPAIGGLLVAPIVWKWAPEARGHGVPEILGALLTRGGRIRPLVALAKALGSAITIGTGGSVGREGPIAQIGASLASTIGQAFRMPPSRLTVLVAAGAAAGIAATFNAPIAGVFFAVEVLLRDLHVGAFASVVVASVVASVIVKARLGDFPAFAVPPYELRSPWELIFYLVLGLLAAVVAWLFVRVLYWMEDRFEALRVPFLWKPFLGGLGVGLLATAVPAVLGTGFSTMERVLRGELSGPILLVLLGAKILASALTLGSGGSGGIFAPSLFLGAALGGAFGEAVHRLFPGLSAPSGAYAMVGMAAVFAAAARAPLTAILMLYEMTRDYGIILPLMFATTVSTLLAALWERESIYTLKLVRRGIDPSVRREYDLMRAILVEEAMTPADRIPKVSPETSLTELAHLFRTSHYHGFPVVDAEGNLVGIVTLSDVERALAQADGKKTAREIGSRDLITVTPDDTLEDAARLLAIYDIGRLPVVDPSNPRRLLGMLGRGDIVRAYARALAGWQERRHHLDTLRLKPEAGQELLEVRLTPRHWAVGKRVCEIPFPRQTIVVFIHRGHRVLIPKGDTELRAGDHLTLLAQEAEADRVRRLLREGP